MWSKCVCLVVGLVMSAGQVFGGATITGTVTFEGKAPTMRTLKMDADPVCADKHEAPVKSVALILGEGNTMGNIFVRVTSGLKKKTYPTPEEPVILDQKGCIYKPHVIGIMVNQGLKILNSDGTLHNVHALSKTNTEFNMAMPKFRKVAVKKFGKEEFIIPVKCDVHPWMQSFVGVLSHPYFSVTEKDGKFSISGLDAGTYEIEAWHERLGTQTATVTVGADESKTVDFTFKRE